MQEQRGGRDISLPIKTSVLEGRRVVNVTSLPLYQQEKGLVAIVQEAGWALGPVWVHAEKLTTIGIKHRTIYLVASRFLNTCVRNNT